MADKIRKTGSGLLCVTLILVTLFPHSSSSVKRGMTAPGGIAPSVPAFVRRNRI